jgi:hypothetical protein
MLIMQPRTRLMSGSMVEVYSNGLLSAWKETRAHWLLCWYAAVLQWECTQVDGPYVSIELAWFAVKGQCSSVAKANNEERRVNGCYHQASALNVVQCIHGIKKWTLGYICTRQTGSVSMHRKTCSADQFSFHAHATWLINSFDEQTYILGWSKHKLQCMESTDFQGWCPFLPRNPFLHTRQASPPQPQRRLQW